MRYLPAFVAAAVLAVILGVVGIVGLRTALNPTAEQVYKKTAQQGDIAPSQLYGSR